MIYEEFPLDVQWGPKATAPTFIHDGQYANLGFLEYMGSGASSTTLRLNSNSFSLISLQLCVPQHKSLLTQDKQKDCSGEFVLGFKTQNKISENYVFLCIPVLTRATTKPSVYLDALRSGSLDGKPTSLLSLLPPDDKHFISYSTCLQRKEQKATVAQQARVFVFTEGLAYPLDKFKDIAKKITASAVSNPIYLPAIQLPEGLMDKSQAMLFKITTETDYKSLLRYSQYYTQQKGDSQYRTDNLNSYKCVPLEPSQNVKDGKIIVDTDSGQLLSQVINEEKITQDTGSTPKITPATVEKLIAACLALIIVGFALVLLAYILTSVTVSNPDDFFNIAKQHIESVSPIVGVSLIVGILGFAIGVFVVAMAK